MKDVYVIYDDLKKPAREIRTITGEKSFGETILKRVTLENRMREECLKNKAVAGFIALSEENDIVKLKQDLTKMQNENAALFYFFSNYGIGDTKEFHSLLQKTAYVNETYHVEEKGEVGAYLISNVKWFFEHAEEVRNRVAFGENVDAKVFVNLSEMSQFLAYITSGFDARFFNSLEGDEHTVTKKSNKIEKIKSEYNFYYFLPDEMKMWFVMPYNYQETKDGAAYTMERYHMTDIAIRFVHGAVSPAELSEILDKLFYFVDHRKAKAVSEAEAEKMADEVYLVKLKERMEQLKKTGYYEKFNQMIQIGTDYAGIEEIVKLYESLYKAIWKKKKEKNPKLVVGHGDLCFSNILYSREASLLKLIDPKGALKEEELYMDPYYDLAKLSHSICGSYDFFNTGLYQVSMDRDMKWMLQIDCDASTYKEIFKEKLLQSGYSYEKVRVLEAGLFLSMLPYHMDQPGKVFGFLLNAVKILEEVKPCIVI